MAISAFQLFVSVAIGVVAAQKEACNTQTNGECTFLACYSSRGQVDCIGSLFSKVCTCQPGFCTSEDKERCIDPSVPVVPSGNFMVGDHVEVQDQKSDPGLSGTVTNVSPLEVQLDECKVSFYFNIVNAADPKYEVGDAVEVKDSGDLDWKSGTVTSVSGGEATVQPIGWHTSFAFKHIRSADWKVAEQRQVANRKKAQVLFAAVAKTTAADAAATKATSEHAEAVAKAAAEEATAKQAALDKASAVLHQADEVESKRTKEEADANSVLTEAKAKQAAAQQASQAAVQSHLAAVADAASQAKASDAAHADALLRKNAVERQLKQEATDTDVVKSMCAEQSNEAMKEAMEAACKSARSALSATRQLRLQLQHAKASADAIDAKSAMASKQAQDAMAARHCFADAALRDETEEAHEVDFKQQGATAAKMAVAEAMVAQKQAHGLALDAKSASKYARAKAKNADIDSSKKAAAMEIAATASRNAAGKNECAASWKIMSTSLFQNAQQRNSAATMLLVIGLLAAVAMLTAAVLCSMPSSDSIALPDSLLG